MDPLAGDLGQRGQDERPRRHPRVGDGEARCGEATLTVEEQVQVENAGLVRDAAAFASPLTLDLEQPREQRRGLQLHLQERGGVEIGALGGPSHRGGFVDTGHGPHLEAGRAFRPGEARPQVRHAIVEVRPECDAGSFHAPSMPTQGPIPRIRRVPSSPATLPPELRTAVPGPRSLALAERLAHAEGPDVTCMSPAPIAWERAAGANVWDVDDNRFVDLGGGFGVANVGHAHPRVVAAVAEQAGTLLHTMGDVYPAAVKVELLEALAARFPGGGPARTVLGSSGADAVEIALKTALLATGRPGVLAFEGGYHGVALGVLDVTHRAWFKEPFAARLPDATRFARFGDVADVTRTAGSGEEVGCVIVEPVQGRGGERVPPRGFLRELRALCDERGWLLIADEVYTGFGRTGRWFACDHEDVVPDLLCVAKGLASGMPISACIGRASVMEAWPPSTGEARHTQTFLGHPPGCAAALASLETLADEKLVERAAATGARALRFLRARAESLPAIREVRGLGLMIGIECTSGDRAATACRRALERGVIALPSGERGEVLSVTPPLCIEPDALEAALATLVDCIA